jgi:serine/threonine protein kinase
MIAQLGHLGTGDFAEVCLARDKRTSETVAMKTLHPNRDNDWKPIQYHHEMKILPLLGGISFDEPKERSIVTPLKRCSLQHCIDVKSRAIELSGWTQNRKHIILIRNVEEMGFMHKMSVSH